MLINKIRLLVQAFSFLILTYGGRIGINLGYALPCFACPYVAGCGGYCFLMFLQRVGIFGIAAYDRIFTYIGLQNLLWFSIFAVSAIILSKFWCGWICPFGSLLDALSGLRKKMGIREIEFSWTVRTMIKPIKYIFLAVILVVPLLIAFLGLSSDFYILFCKICPARPIMPIFAGDIRRFGLEYSNWSTLIISIVSVSFAAITIVGSFFKDRFFCMVCPMLPLIHLFNKLSPVRFVKWADGCSGCGNCQRVCPMDIREVHLEKKNGMVMTEDCILCTQCMQACPENNVLKLQFFNKNIFISLKNLRRQLVEKMNDKLNFIDERQKRRYEKVLQKTEEEYLQEIAILKSREDFLEEYEYFLQLLASPFSARKLQMRVEKPLAGLFCIQAPFEIFDAFDLHPVKLCGGSHTVQRLAASYLPVLMCPMLKSFMGNFDLQQESFADYRAVILPTTCDWVVKLPEIMQQDTENVHYLELPHLKETEKSQSRWLEEIFCLKQLLEKITGKKLKPKQLQESINKVMNIWIIMDELTKLKRSGQLSGVWYTAITNTFMLDNLEVWSGQVNRTIEKLHRQQKQENSSRIFVAGSPIIFPNLKLLQLIEQAGMSITADDICSSERIMPGGIIYNDTSEYGMLRAIAERYHKACVCPTFADNSRRVNNIISTAKEYNIKGVIFNLLKGCHPYDIEAITIERKLKEHGLKFIKIETDYGKEDSQNILTRLEAFKQTL